MYYFPNPLHATHPSLHTLALLNLHCSLPACLLPESLEMWTVDQMELGSHGTLLGVVFLHRIILPAHGYLRRQPAADPAVLDSRLQPTGQEVSSIKYSVTNG